MSGDESTTSKTDAKGKTEQQKREREARFQKRQIEMAQAQLQQQLNQALERLAALEAERALPNPAAQNFNGESLFAAGSSLKPSVFRGGYNPTFAEWIERFEEIAIAHKWEGNRRAEVIQLFLDGGARLAFRSLPDQTKGNYDQLKQALLRILQPVESPRFYSQLLYGPKARKLQPGENVSTYAADIQKFVLGAHAVSGEFPEAAQKQIMREAFISGLPSEMKNAVMDKEPTDFNEALDIANKIEARNFLIRGEAPSSQAGSNYQSFAVNLNKSSKPTNQFAQRTNEYTSTGRVQNFRNRDYRKPQRFFNNDNYQSKSESFKNNTNWIPNKYKEGFRTQRYTRGPSFRDRVYGSFTRPLSDRFRQQQTKPYFQNSSNNFKGNKVCTFCHREGHNYEECRLKDRTTNMYRVTPTGPGPHIQNKNFRSGPNFRFNARNPSHRVNLTNVDQNLEQAPPTAVNEDKDKSDSVLREYLQKFDDKLEAYSGKVEKLHEQLKESSSSQFHSNMFQTYPLIKERNHEKRCMFHSIFEWDSLDQSCKRNLECPYGHLLNPQSAVTYCTKLGCPSGPLCSLCCHAFSCTNCGGRTSAVPTDSLSHTQELSEEYANHAISKKDLKQIHFKKLSSTANTPSRTAGNQIIYNLFSAHDYFIPSRSRRVCYTDIVFELPKDCYGKIMPNSNLAMKNSIDTVTTIVDRTNQSNIGILLINNSDSDFLLNHGEVLAHLVFEKAVHVELVNISRKQRSSENLDQLEMDPNIPTTSKRGKSFEQLHHVRTLTISSSMTLLTLLFWFSFLCVISPIHSVHMSTPSSLHMREDLKFGHNKLYNLCGRSRSGHAIEVPKIIKCIGPESNASIDETRVELWVPNPKPQVSEAAKCYKVAQLVCTYYSVFFAKSVLENTKIVEPVSFDDCRIALQNKTYKGKNLTKHGRQIWSTNQKPKIVFQYCCYTHCDTTRNFILELGKVATMNGVELNSDLGDVGSCHAKYPAKCLIAKQRYIWKPILSKPCPFVSKGVFNAVVSQNHIVIDELQGAFTLTASGHEYHNLRKPGCLPYDSFATEQGVVMKFVSKHISKFNWTSKQVSNQSISDPVNNKLEYLKFKILESEQRSFRAIWLELCNLAQRQLTLIWQLLRIDATLGARVLLGQNDIHAEFAGEALMTWPCVQLSPDVIFWNYTILNTCYEFIPVLYRGKIFFIIPGTMDLITQSPIVPCVHHLVGIHKTNTFSIDGSRIWKSPSGPVSVTKIPIQLIWKNTWKPFAFSSPALFHDQVAGYSSSVGMLKSYVYRVNRIENLLDHLINYTAEFSANPAIVRKALVNAGKGLHTVAVKTGTAISHLWSGIEKGASNLLSGILKGTLQIIVNVIVLILVMVIIPYILICFVIPKVMKFFQNNCVHNKSVKSEQPQQRRLQVKLHKRSLGKPNFCSSELITDSESRVENGAQVDFSELEPLNGLGHRIDYVTSNNHPNTLTKLVIIVEINKIDTRCLVDTGSSITLMSWSHFSAINDQNGNNLKTLTLREVPSSLEAKSVTGHMLEIIGLSTLQFKLPNGIIDHEVVVVPEVGYSFDAIIGLDFINKFSLFSVDILKAEVAIGNNSFRFESTYSVVYPSKRHRIPPYSSILVNCHVYRTYPDDMNVIFEPNCPYLSSKGIVSDFCVNTVQNQTISILLVNPSEFLKVLKVSMPLGMCYPLIERQIHQFCCSNVTTEKPSKNLKHPKCHPGVQPVQKLSAKEQQQFDELVTVYSDVFALNDTDFGHTTILRHKIQTQDALPIKQKPYPVPFSQREAIEKYIEQMSNLNIIQPSISPWASPIVIVKKKDGSDRFCVDYRKLNSVTVKDVYPLPRIDDILYTLSNTNYYTSLDLLSGYWQVEVAEEDRQKTAFTSHFGGLWEFSVLPFGLCGAPATFQRLMETVLRGYLWKFCFCYIDDILIASSSFEEHINHLKLVFQRLRDANLKVKTRKCQFIRPQISFLGHVVSKNGIEVDPEKTIKVINFPTPNNVTEVKSFLGLASYYRRFIKNFAAKAVHLHKLLKKDVPFQWSKDCESSFEELKESLTKPPVLAYPNFSKPFIIQTDASTIGLGAVLAQTQEENGKCFEHPIAYASRVLLKSELKLPPIELEAIAVIFAFKQFRSYVYGYHVIVQTDHAPLKWLLSTSLPSGRLQKPALKLSEFDFEIHYKPGKNNTNADALSRRPKSPEKSLVVSTLVTDEQSVDLVKLQIADSHLKPLIEYLNLQILPTDDESARRTIFLAEKYTIIDNVLYHIDHSQHNIHQLVVPDSMKTHILELAHSNILAGHLGIQKTYHKLKQTYYWSNMYKDVVNFCRTCIDCQLRKPRHPVTKMPLNPIPVEGPFDKVAVDILGPLKPHSEDGHQYIIIYTEYLTRWVEAFALYDIKATTIAKTFVEGIVCRYGAPRQLLSDKGTNFLSELVKEVCNMLCTKKINTTAYHPQCDGLVERFNKTLTDMLSIYISSNQQNWHKLIPFALFAYRTSIHSSLRETPYYLMFGHDARLPQEASLLPPSRYIIDIDDYKFQLQYFLNMAWKLATKKLSEAQEVQEMYYNRKTKFEIFNEGDLILLYKPAVEPGLNKKFHKPWFGPYRILKVLNKNALIQPLNKPDHLKEYVSLDRIKRFYHTIEPADYNRVHEKNIVADKRKKPLPLHNYNLRPRKMVQNAHYISSITMSDPPSSQGNKTPTHDEEVFLETYQSLDKLTEVASELISEDQQEQDPPVQSDQAVHKVPVVSSEPPQPPPPPPMEPQSQEYSDQQRRVAFCMTKLPSVEVSKIEKYTARDLAAIALRLLPLIKPKSKSNGYFQCFCEFIRQYSYSVFLQKFEITLSDVYVKNMSIDSALEPFHCESVATGYNTPAMYCQNSCSLANFNYQNSSNQGASAFQNQNNQIVTQSCNGDTHGGETSQPEAYYPSTSVVMGYQPNLAAQPQVFQPIYQVPNTTPNFGTQSFSYPNQARLLVLPWNLSQEKITAIMQLLNN